MNKAVPWNINGVGFDAREAAREAARRQGKSLGEWLHGVIADHATELGIEERDVVGQDRIDAVTSRLERMSARSAKLDDRLRDRDDRGAERLAPRGGRQPIGEDTRDDEIGPARRRSARRFAEEPTAPRRARRDTSMIEETEFLLEEAIDTMERRALQAERRADAALDTFTKLLERNEEKRDRERESVSALTQKLSAIETRLVADDQSPIKGALARLEARLDMIGRRSTAEANARRNATPPSPTTPVENPEPMRRLEEKMNTLLDAISARPAPAPVPPAIVAPVAGNPAPAPELEVHARQRRLGEAIAEIAGRQRTLDGPSAMPLDRPHRLADRLRTGVSTIPAAAPQPALAAMQGEIAALTAKIDSLCRNAATPPVADERGGRAKVDVLEREVRAIGDKIDGLMRGGVETKAVARLQDQMEEIRDLVSSGAARPPAVDHIEHQLAALTERLERQAVQARLAPVVDNTGLDKIEGRLELLAAKVDVALARGDAVPAEAAPDAVALEGLVRDLTARIDAVGSPGADAQAIEALQHQISLLSSRFERSESGLAAMTGLERSMHDLFGHLEATRASVETSAARAAREVLQIAIDEGKSYQHGDSDGEVAALKALHDEADLRTQSTLDVMHEALEKMVDRLALMEGDLAEVRKRPTLPLAAPAPAPRPAASERPAGPPSASRPEKPRPEKQLPDKPTQVAAMGMALGAPDPLLDPIGVRPADRMRSPAAVGGRGKPTDLDEGGARADFIAAARRAAQAAQADPAAVAIKRQGGREIGASGKGPARAELMSKSRDYVASHKRPVLLALAAVFVIVGTMALMQRSPFGGGGSDVADAAPPARVAAFEAPPSALPKSSALPISSALPKPDVGTGLGALSPSELPRGAPALSTRIPGSDPIQTGSIPSLPAFAAHPEAAAPAGLPTGLEASAQSGDGAAQYVLGAAYGEGKVVPRDFKQAAKWYAKAADHGIAPALYRLGSLYEKGLGVAQDKARAKRLYTEAADAGNPRAMHNLAVLLADGDGKPDYEGAATWFRKAAQFGIHDSEYNFAILLARGMGVEQSLVQSYQWFAIAALQNDPDAAQKRDEVASKLSPSDLAVAKALAAAFHPRSPDPAAVDVTPPPGGWDGAAASSPLNSARSKISSL